MSALISIEEVSPYIIVWKTNTLDTANPNQLTLYTSSELAYDYSVDWGDGNSDTGVTGDITHTYNSPGEYTLRITGQFPQPLIPEGEECKIISVDQWGNRPWLSMQRAFAGCSNLVINDSEAPNL